MSHLCVRLCGRPPAEARRCAECVVGKMRPTDAVALVQFDSQVQRLWPALSLGDGGALTDTAAIAAQCPQWAARGVTNSTCGFGDGFNEELMVSMARAGG